MDSLKTVLDSTDIILENHMILCIVYVLFFVVALIMRKSTDKIEKKAGKILIGASVPGLIISVTGLVLFFYATVRGMKLADDSHELWVFVYDCKHVLYTLVEISVIIFPIQSLFTIITGIVVNSKTARKLRGRVAIVAGILLLCFSLFYIVGYIALLGE